MTVAFFVYDLFCVFLFLFIHCLSLLVPSLVRCSEEKGKKKEQYDPLMEI